MSKRACEMKTEQESVDMDEDAQQVLAQHVFAGALRLRLYQPGALTMNALVSVPKHLKRASRVCKAWRRAFAEWVPRGLAGASAQAWASAIAAGLDKCQYSAYVQHTVPGVPRLPVLQLLPPETKVGWQLYLHGRTLGTLTLTRRFRGLDAAAPDSAEHWLQVVYQPHRASRAQVPKVTSRSWQDAQPLVAAEVLIPHANWAEDNGWRSANGETAVEQWTREKQAWLEAWVRLRHAELTLGWRVTTQDPLFYYC